MTAAQLSEEPLLSVHPRTKRTLENVAKVSSVKFAAVVDDEGTLVRGVGEVPSSLRPVLAAGHSERGANPQLIESMTRQNVQVFQASLPDELGQHRWLLMGMQDVAAQRAVLDGACAIGGMLIAAAFLQVPLVLGRFRRWTASLHELHSAIRRLALGIPARPVPVSGDDEAAYVAVAFNEMASKLMAGKRALIDANQRLEERVAQRTEELHVANTTLERQNAKLEQVTETALRFTDDVAHEFRTPLTVVSEFASLMTDGIGGPVTPQQAEYLSFISDASRDLARLVDDFLDSSKLRARSLRVVRKEQNVGEILDGIWPMLRARAKSLGVGLERFVDTDTPLVYADGEKAGRAITNLTINALKFSKPGATVCVHCSRADNGGAHIAVTDQGPGLTEAEVATLFERFKQTASGRSSGSKGFGLGLSIVRELVFLNLGAISIKSARGQGSSFGFTLPPNEPEVIVDMLLARIRERDVAPTVGVLRVVHPSDELDDAFQSSLAALAYPLDVQILIPGEPRALLLVGATLDVERWRERLRGELERGRDMESTLPNIDIAIALPLEAARDHVLSTLSEPVSALEAIAS